jgi:hypothetical protein
MIQVTIIKIQVVAGEDCRYYLRSGPFEAFESQYSPGLTEDKMSMKEARPYLSLPIDWLVYANEKKYEQ